MTIVWGYSDFVKSVPFSTGTDNRIITAAKPVKVLYSIAGTKNALDNIKYNKEYPYDIQCFMIKSNKKLSVEIFKNISEKHTLLPPMAVCS